MQAGVKIMKNEQVIEINEATVAWRKMAFLLKDLQSKVISVKKIDELIDTLLEADLQLDDMEELSIIYRHEGSEEAVFLAHKGEAIHEGDSPSVCFTPDNACIDTIIKQADQKNRYLNTQQACSEAGFVDYKSVLVIPMRLNATKNVGAFVLHHLHRENAYTDDIQEAWEVLSDQMTFFIRTHVRIQYNKMFDNVRNDLLMLPFENENDLLMAVVEYVRRWYQEDDIYVLIKNTMNLDTYFLAYDNDAIQPDFRCNGVMNEQQIAEIAGGEQILQQLEKQHEIVINSPTREMQGLKAGCRSWLGAAFHHPAEYNLGFIILHNRQKENAYALGEDAFLDRIADFTALLLADYRARKKYKFTQKIHNFRIKNTSDEERLYAEIYHFLHQAYGINSLAIAKIDRISQLVSPVFNHGEKTIPFDDTLQQVAIQHSESLRNETHADADKLTVWHEKHQQHYLISPMRTGEEDGSLRVLGCFIIPVTKAGSISARVINRLSDTLAQKIEKFDLQTRNETLNRFGKRVSQLSTHGLTEEKILRIAHEYIAEAMFTENLYIALFNQGEISFPLMLKNGKPWPQATRPKPRRLNPLEQGKTEAIIISQQPILHLSNDESRAWYTDPDHPERQEFVDDYLASWVGVPIFYNDGVAGVIASYHPTIDYVYSQADMFFLQNIGHQMSRLLLALELAEKQAKIAEQQHVLSTSLLAQDLTHRLNNSIGGMMVTIKQAQKDIESAITFENTERLDFTLEGLEETEVMLKELIKETKSISDDSTQSIQLSTLLKKISIQVGIGKRLDDIHVNTILDFGKNLNEVNAHYRTLFNSLYAIVDNAADALVAQQREEGENDALFLSISARQDDDGITIDIKDNGILVPARIKNEIFEHGVSGKGDSGFGLWRSRAVIQNLEGSLTFTENVSERQKVFTLYLPTKKQPLQHKKLAYVLDDEKTWRNALDRWLSEDGFHVEVTDNKQAMLLLLKDKQQTASHVFLDISLDTVDGSNLDGLSLVKEVKHYLPQAKIIIVTGYARLSGAYSSDYDVLIEKITEDGDVLNKHILLEKLEAYI
jgi:nitrogen-specific signal transduction histidine kinase